ncbi:MAG: DUF3038 domain-containing protein [Cyanobacteriota bacterium]|nr:DUF3038 domain-containing protein [Cyanobacteriota bacterium]
MTQDNGSRPTEERPLPRRGLERLDLMLLCLEALDFNGGEALLWLSGQLGYGGLFPNRVELWKRRCHNPLRRACRRGELAAAETDALIRILCVMADRLYPMLRALLSSAEDPAVREHRWELFRQRLAELLLERMNPRRSGIQTLIDPQQGAEERRLLIQSLALAAGNGGFDRLKASLMDAVG